VSDDKKISWYLNAAANMLARPNGWTQYAFARNVDGESVLAGCDYAVCFCVSGALRYLTRERSDLYWEDGHPMVLTQRYIRTAAGCDSVWNWNDAPGRTQQEVVDTLRAAAKLAEHDEDETNVKIDV